MQCVSCTRHGELPVDQMTGPQLTESESTTDAALMTHAWLPSLTRGYGCQTDKSTLSNARGCHCKGSL